MFYLAADFSGCEFRTNLRPWFSKHVTISLDVGNVVRRIDDNKRRSKERKTQKKLPGTVGSRTNKAFTYDICLLADKNPKSEEYTSFDKALNFR